MDGVIAAVITPMGVGAVGIVRLSGDGALMVASRVFRSYSGRGLDEIPGFSGLLGQVYDSDGPIDEVIAYVYRAPRSYTGQDVVELNCHGGEFGVRRVLRLCLDAGADIAQAGEFTRRAFLNGKLDLAQAESVAEIISAQGGDAMRAAMYGRKGALSRKVAEIESLLTMHLAEIAAWNDYPDEDLEPICTQRLYADLSDALDKLETLADGYESGRILREGITAVIFGRPNVGKSRLMNLLSGRERSIVTEHPGTTRDIVEQRVNIKASPFTLADTAGIRNTSDPIESVGVRLALDMVESADIILAVFDSSAPLSEDDEQVMAAVSGRRVVAVLNKTDLPSRLTPADLPFERVVQLSALNGNGRDRLETEIISAVGVGQIDPTAALVISERQRLCIKAAAENLRLAISALEDGITLDAVCVCLESAVDELLALTGKRVGEQVIEQVFANFCVGK